MNGVLPVNKPAGFTSFDVIAKLRGILKTRRIGHSGTLDPIATGVLPVFVGKATAAADLVSDRKKRYTAGFRLGLTTDTQDVTGKVLAESGNIPGREAVSEALSGFIGKQSQLPPMFSAVKVGGKRLYDLARQGVEVERTPREIEIFSAELLELDPEKGEGTLDILCSKGTYIRTLIHDLGGRLGCGGIMTSLVRTYSQGFEINDCYSLDEIETAAKNGGAEGLFIPVDRLFAELPEARLDPRQERLYKNGVKLDPARLGLSEGIRYRLYGSEFLGIGEARGGELRTVKNFFGDDRNKQSGAFGAV